MSLHFAFDCLCRWLETWASASMYLAMRSWQKGCVVYTDFLLSLAGVGSVQISQVKVPLISSSLIFFFFFLLGMFSVFNWFLLRISHDFAITPSRYKSLTSPRWLICMITLQWIFKFIETYKDPTISQKLQFGSYL